VVEVTGRRRQVAVLLTASLLLAGCAGAADSDGGPGAGQWATKTASAGPVEVQVTPDRIDAERAVFGVELDNHEVELTGDYTDGSTLTVAGLAWGEPTWTGDGPSGHHRTGTLTFPAAGEPTGRLVLRLAGLPAPVVLRWARS
jgi:hypothetical protein